MVQSKKLNFDIIATKPATAARLPDKEAATEAEETYIKLHTFSTKREFLYNVLLEYPTLRRMHIWDDRPGQIAQFRRAGEVWIEQGMLETFEITPVRIPTRSFEREQEIAVVKTMVEIHNRQVDAEARGGRFLVSGVGALPSVRPELKHVEDMWGPVLKYVPERRTRIELMNFVQYTAVGFSESTQAVLRGFARGGGVAAPQEQGHGHVLDGWKIQPPAALRDADLSSWTSAKEFYIFLCARRGSPEYRRLIGGVGATVFVVVEAVGQIEGKAWAVKVRGVHSRRLRGYKILAPDGVIFPSVESYLAAHPVKRFGNVTLKRPGSSPYITMAFDRSQDARASDAAKVEHWEPLNDHGSSALTHGKTAAAGGGQKIALVGTIQEKVLIGAKMPKFGHLATVPRAEIHIPGLVKMYLTEKKLDITGHELGVTLKSIEAEMTQLSISNMQNNHDQISEIVHRICEQLHSSPNGSA